MAVVIVCSLVAFVAKRGLETTARWFPDAAPNAFCMPLRLLRNLPSGAEPAAASTPEPGFQMSSSSSSLPLPRGFSPSFFRRTEGNAVFGNLGRGIRVSNSEPCEQVSPLVLVPYRPYILLPVIDEWNHNKLRFQISRLMLRFVSRRFPIPQHHKSEIWPTNKPNAVIR